MTNMAYIKTRRKWANCLNDYQYEFVLDSDADVANLPECKAGSTAMVSEGGNIYMTNTKGEWKLFAGEAAE